MVARENVKRGVGLTYGTKKEVVSRGCQNRLGFDTFPYPRFLSLNSTNSPQIVKDILASLSDRSYDHKNNGVLQRMSETEAVLSHKATIAFLLNSPLPFRYLSAVDLVTLS